LNVDKDASAGLVDRGGTAHQLKQTFWRGGPERVKGWEMSIEQDIFHALYIEHKRLTGHDVYIEKHLASINCDTCLYLDKIRRAYDVIEKYYYGKGGIL